MVLQLFPEKVESGFCAVHEYVAVLCTSWSLGLHRNGLCSKRWESCTSMDGCDRGAFSTAILFFRCGRQEYSGISLTELLKEVWVVCLLRNSLAWELHRVLQILVSHTLRRVGVEALFEALVVKF